MNILERERELITIGNDCARNIIQESGACEPEEWLDTLKCGRKINNAYQDKIWCDFFFPNAVTLCKFDNT